MNRGSGSVRRLAIGTLSVGLVAQLVYVGGQLGNRQPAAPASPGQLDSLVGAPVDGVRAPALTLIGAESGTVLLAFSSRCGWCDSVADLWAEELQRTPEAAPLILISADEPSAATAYAKERRWTAPIFHVDTSGARAN